METKATGTPEQVPSALPTQAEPVTATRRPRRWGIWALLAISVVGLVSLIVCALCASAVFGPIVRGYGEQDQIIAQVEQFMQAMEDRDADAAYALFSPRARRCFNRSDVDAMLEGANYVLFEDYQSTAMLNLNFENWISTDVCEAQGVRAWVTGVVYYDGGFQGTFEAGLERGDDGWHLHSINITVPPEKIQGFQDNG